MVRNGSCGKPERAGRLASVSMGIAVVLLVSGAGARASDSARYPALSLSDEPGSAPWHQLRDLEDLSPRWGGAVTDEGRNVVRHQATASETVYPAAPMWRVPPAGVRSSPVPRQPTPVARSNGSWRYRPGGEVNSELPDGPQAFPPMEGYTRPSDSAYSPMSTPTPNRTGWGIGVAAGYTTGVPSGGWSYPSPPPSGHPLRDQPPISTSRSSRYGQRAAATPGYAPVYAPLPPFSNEDNVPRARY